MKEKIINNTIEYIPNLYQNILNTLDSKYSVQKVYHSFLIKNIDLIVRIAKTTNNLRTLIFSLDYFQYIFSEIEINITNHEILVHKKNEILTNSLQFTLAISFEYKQMNISYKSRREIDNENLRLNYWNLEGLDPTDDYFNSFRHNFQQKYYEEKNYNFHESIYAYITGANIFEYDFFLSELKKQYYIFENQVSPQYSIYDQMMNNVFDLTDDQYNKKLKQLLMYADKGFYQHIDYFLIFRFITRYNNPLNFPIKDITERLKKGVDKSLKISKFVDDLENYLPTEGDENIDHRIDLKEYILKINNELNMLESEERSEKLEKLFYSNLDIFEQEVFDKKNKYHVVPIFNSFNVDKFVIFFDEINNFTKARLLEFLKNRYNNVYFIDIKLELSFFQSLNNAIKAIILKGKNNGIEYHLNNQLLSLTEIVIQQILTPESGEV